MLRAAVYVDLPSAETERVPRLLEWVRSLFGARLHLKSGVEELTMGAFSLVEALIEGFARAGVDDVIAFLVDRQVVYCDMNDVSGDLPLIARAAEAAGVLERPFREMHLVLAHQDASLHTIIDCQIKSSTFVGTSEMHIDLSSRLSDLRVRSGETAERYAERIKAFAEKADSFEPGRRWLDALAKDVASSLGAVLTGARVSCGHAVVKLIRPGVHQIGRFGNLRFGDDVQAPQYRPVPTLQRAGAYADPFYYYYYDPYYDFVNYVLVDTLQRGSAWRSPVVYVVDPTGSALFGGIEERSPPGYWVGNDAVRYDSSGSLTLRESLPTWSDDDRGTSWLNEPAWSHDGTFRYASTFSNGGSSGSSSSCGSSSSSSSSSSCGSSGSSSSCGSSCSSGSSCGSSCSSGSSCNSS